MVIFVVALPRLITVHGTYLKLDGTPDQGYIQFKSSVQSLDSGSDTIVVPGEITKYIDSQGHVSLTIPATNDPEWTPVGWTYTFIGQFSHSFYSFDVVIPFDAPGQQLALNSLVPAQSANSQLYATYNHVHNEYVLASEVDEFIGDSVGNAVTEQLGNYATTSALASGLASKADTSALASYATLTQLGTKADSSELAGKANIADLASYATDEELALKAPLASPNFTGTVTGVTKAMVGLANADNTSDVNKPVSTAQQTALNAKANTSHTHTVSNVTGLQTALDSKQPSGDYALNSDITALDTRLDSVEAKVPAILSWNGSSYVANDSARIYSGPNDPGSVPDGSIWIGYTP